MSNSITPISSVNSTPATSTSVSPTNLVQTVSETTTTTTTTTTAGSSQIGSNSPQLPAHSNLNEIEKNNVQKDKENNQKEKKESESAPIKVDLQTNTPM